MKVSKSMINTCSTPLSSLLCRPIWRPTLLLRPSSPMEQHCPLPDTTHQQEAADASSVLYRLAERASEFSINLNGSIRRTLGRYPVHGGTAIVYHGTWIPHGTEVAIKTFRNALSESEADLKRLFKEVHTWSKLHHENIVPMFGISTEFNSTLSIISEWMPLGNAHNYVQNTENDPRPLLEDIASGLYYLHSHELGLVHGDLRGVNAVVSNDCRALLTDFGLSTLNISTFSMTVNPKNGISLRWTAPELLEDGRASKASDVWAFGMTILELFTRAVPFSDCSSSARVMSRIMTGKLPPRPSAEATQSRMADVWWEICTSCWGSNPSSRPTMRDIVETVKAVLHQARATSLPQRTPPVERDCYFADSTRQEPVIEVSSVLRELCNRASTYGIVLNGRLSRTSGSNPLHGGTASVYHGTLTPDCAEVAIKTFRSLGPGNEAELKRIFREVHVWSKLHHENVVRMLGISTEFDSTLSIISEWMPLGNAHTYVKNTENDPRPLIKDIASGLCYLHSYTSPPGPIVHGDLKGFNVMVSSDHRALLTDFGLSTLNISTFNMTVEPTRGYSSHWAALEILDNHPASTASDVWAFGMTILELFTRTVPFPDCRGPLQVIAMLAKRKLPHRPALESTLFRLTDAWWEICLSCWENDPSSRPTTKDIIEKVETAIFRAGPALTSPEASGSACPKSEERDSYPISE
ncbi:kinase-like domain-containing protein [Pisolithus sp. B1]|nr:kinase-like domain-containing protein [Pisolithus sp. B1]